MTDRALVRKQYINILENSENIEETIEIPDPGDPEEIIVSDENWKEIENRFENDPDGFIIFCDWLDSASPGKIADNYGLDIKIVYNAVRKAKRIITKIFTISNK
jgi:hypothetical protein